MPSMRSFRACNGHPGSPGESEDAGSAPGRPGAGVDLLSCPVLTSVPFGALEAMASYTPPAEGQTTMPPDLASALAPALAANWQHA